MGKPVIWTLDQDDQLLLMQKAGRSYNYMAEQLERTISAVQTRLSHLKSQLATGRPTRPPDWTPEDDERLETLRENGVSCEEIADEFNRTVPAVRTRLSFLKAKKRAIST